MRPRPVVGEATVPDAVRRLLDKFDYPDRESPAQIIPILTTLGGGGGAPSVVVAAADATELSKSKADFQCTGTDDHVEIQAAIDLLETSGGRVLLTEGTFWVQTNQIDLAGSSGGGGTQALWLQGLDWLGTIIRSNDTAGSLVAVADNSQVTDIYFYGGGQVGTVGIGGTRFDIGIGNGGDDVYINRCGFQNLDTAIRLSGSRWHITDNKPWSTVDWFVTDLDGFIETIIANNHTLIGLIDMGIGTDWIISDNYFAGGSIQASNPERVIISSNHFNSIGVDGNTFGIELTGTTGIDIEIADNLMPNAGAGGVLLDGVTRATVVGNSMWGTTNGIEVKNSDAVLVESNLVVWSDHGIVFDATSDSALIGNMVREPGTNTDNTYDGILLLGNSDRNDIWNNKITGKSAANQPRYGINISAATCDINSYLGNRTGPAADYGTGAYNDAGTATVNTWPGAAAPQGDNLL